MSGLRRMIGCSVDCSVDDRGLVKMCYAKYKWNVSGFWFGNFL